MTSILPVQKSDQKSVGIIWYETCVENSVVCGTRCSEMVLKVSGWMEGGNMGKIRTL